MPSRQESSSPSASTSTKRSGHQRNPMACTNCRARKIKCDSNRQYPDRPCQRCITRKLHCEYVAISHSPTNDTFQRSGPFTTSSATPLHSEYVKHGYTPSTSPPLLLPRYTPHDPSFTPKSSKDANISSLPPNFYHTSYGNPPSQYSSLETASLYPYNPSYSANPGFDQTTVTSASTVNQIPNIANNLRGPNARYAPSGMPMNAPLDAGQWIGQNGGDWSSYSSANTNMLQGQYYYNSECRCTGMQCTCGNHGRY